MFEKNASRQVNTSWTLELVDVVNKKRKIPLKRVDKAKVPLRPTYLRSTIY
jgi:hypothetical protein